MGTTPLRRADRPPSLYLNLAEDDGRPLGLPEPPFELLLRLPGWELSEVLESHETVARRLAEIEVLRGRGPNVTSLVPRRALPRPLDRAGSAPRLLRLFQLWDRGRGRVTPELLAVMEREGLLDRCFVMALDRREQALTYRYIGQELALRFGMRWCASIGMRVDSGEQHDPAYSRWCALAYEKALAGAPTREAIDVAVAPLRRGAPASRVQYERLLLPVEFAGGAIGVLGLSALTPGALPLA